MPNSAKIPSIRLSPYFIFIWILCDSTEFGQFASNVKSQGKDLAMRYLPQFTWTPSSVRVTTPRISAVSFWHHLLLFRAIHTQMCIDRHGCAHKMYKEAESDLAVKFSYISSQYKSQSWFFSISFLKSPEHQSSHPKPRARANSGAALSSTAGILNIHGKQAKNCRKRKKKRMMLTARSTPGQLCTRLVRGWGCIRSENKVRRVCQLEMGKLCNYLNMSMPACSERRLGTWIHFYTC